MPSKNARKKQATVEPGYRPLGDKLEDPGLPQEVKDLVRMRHVAQRGEIGQTSGAIQLAFFRGYAGGYEDRVMGNKPKHPARTTRKQIGTDYGSIGVHPGMDEP